MWLRAPLCTEHRSHHEINQFCSNHHLTEVYITEFDTVDEKLTNALQEDCDKWNTGIEILSIRVTKPRIPEAIQANYEQMESEKTRLRVAEQTQKVIVKEAETAKAKAIVEAQKAAEISAINMQKRLAEKAKYAEMEAIADEMTTNKLKAQTDASYYAKVQAAEGNRARLSPRFLQEQLLRRMANTTKQYYGRTLTDVLAALDLDQVRARVTTVQASPESEKSSASSATEE
jgi:regulator of protease activity HflC (stomatin/prohibitin superfamily)